MKSEPLIFRIMNIELNYHTHCGVLDFTAEEDCCYLPNHMFERLCLIEGMTVNVRNVVLEKGTFVKFKPHKTEFIMNPNPKVILENSLREYVCVTVGDTITVEFNKKKYLIDVVECKPKNTICLTNVDIKVDFEEPKDYETEMAKLKKTSSKVDIKEEVEKKPLTEEELKSKLQDEKFKGNCIRIDGKKITEKQVSFVEKKKEEDTYDPRKHRLTHGLRNSYIGFVGNGKSIK